MIELDKNLIKKNFQKSINSYENNAIVQKNMAHTLINLAKEKITTPKKILEIGSYTGVLTKEFLKNYQNFNSYLALDLINCFEHIKNLDKRINFKQVDFEEFNTNEKFDLIISNATLQWAKDFPLTVKKFKSFLNKNGVLIISTFDKENMFEIKDVFNIGLNYYDLIELQNIFPSALVIEDSITLQFQNPIDILKHLKYSGVNSIVKNKLNYKEIKEKLILLDKKYHNKITYKPMYMIIN